MIEIQDLHKSFGKLQVLRGVNLSLGSGEVISVIGPNGSGKTTLIKCILGMVMPDKGSLLIDGQSILHSFDYRRKIGYMPQIGRFPDNMRMGHLFRMIKDLRKDCTVFDEEMIQVYNLESMFQKQLGTLSGGTRQKVSAALAFLFQPDILILDEPTAGLDPVSAEMLKDKILKSKQEGKLVIITSHIMSEVEEMADKVMYLYEGRIHFFKTIEEIKAETGESRLGKAVAKLIQ